MRNKENDNNHIVESCYLEVYTRLPILFKYKILNFVQNVSTFWIIHTLVKTEYSISLINLLKSDAKI